MIENKPVPSEVLDDIAKGMPGGKFYFHAACHPEGEIEASYRTGSNALRIGCRECKKQVALIAVSPGGRDD